MGGTEDSALPWCLFKAKPTLRAFWFMIWIQKSVERGRKSGIFTPKWSIEKDLLSALSWSHVIVLFGVQREVLGFVGAIMSGLFHWSLRTRWKSPVWLNDIKCLWTKKTAEPRKMEEPHIPRKQHFRWYTNIMYMTSSVFPAHHHPDCSWVFLRHY